MAMRNYSADDVQQILAIAMGQQDTVREPQLKEMAAKLSIDDASLQYAVEAWQAQKTQAQKKRQQRQRFYWQSLFPYLAVNAFLVILNVSIAGAITWAVYPLAGWGVGLLLELWGVEWGMGCERLHPRKCG